MVDQGVDGERGRGLGAGGVRGSRSTGLSRVAGLLERGGRRGCAAAR
jgi:hypothetical protein